jgi:predicted nucleotidyltransferase
MFGLKQEDITEICEILSKFQEIEQADIFGSRAKGNFKNGSDVDIAIKGKACNSSIALRISAILNEETNMPYHFDVLCYSNIKNQDLRDHIERVGKVIFKREYDL